MAETEVGYGGWRKHTSGGLSDTFQTTGRQSDFRSNHRRVICNYPKGKINYKVGYLAYIAYNKEGLNHVHACMCQYDLEENQGKF